MTIAVWVTAMEPVLPAAIGATAALIVAGRTSRISKVVSSMNTKLAALQDLQAILGQLLMALGPSHSSELVHELLVPEPDAGSFDRAWYGSLQLLAHIMEPEVTQAVDQLWVAADRRYIELCGGINSPHSLREVLDSVGRLQSTVTRCIVELSQRLSK